MITDHREPPTGRQAVAQRRERARQSGEPFERDTVIIAAAKEVGPALFYSLVIITLSFLPVFTLQAQEGRLFTKVYAHEFYDDKATRKNILDALKQPMTVNDVALVYFAGGVALCLWGNAVVLARVRD